jgi:hypothetical protein
MECKGCNNKPATIPYIAHEAILAKSERREHRLFTALVVAVSAFLISNTAWVCYFVLK